MREGESERERESTIQSVCKVKSLEHVVQERMEG